MRRTLIVSEYGPPMLSGPAILLGNLFRYFPKGSYCILMKNVRYITTPTEPKTALDCKYYYCNIPEYEEGRPLRVGTLSRILEFLLIPYIVWKGVKIVKKEEIDNVLGPSNSGHFLISAYLISKITKKMLYIYLFDVYEEYLQSRLQRFMAKLFEKRILMSASKIFVMSEHLRDHYLNKYGISTEVILQPVVQYKYNEDLQGSSPPNNNAVNIVFTGIVSKAQLDAIKNMVDVVNSFEDETVKFRLYTPTPFGQLARLGISGKNVESGFAQKDEISEIQRKADISFLPLAFNSPYPIVVRTASPTKMPEYLAARRPILVHAPSYSYISYYANKNGFGLVVDKSDLQELKKAVLSLAYDKNLQRKLIENASRTLKNHDAHKISKRLQSFLLT